MKQHYCIGICFLIILPLLVGCDTTSVLDYLTISEGNPTEWFGITPGRTTLEETLLIMDNHPQVDTSNEYLPVNREDDGKTRTIYYLEDMYAVVTFQFNETDVVERIVLSVNSTNIEDVFSILGEPEYIFTDRYIEHPLDVTAYSSTLIYEQYFLTASTLLEKQKGELQLNEHSIVNIVALYSEDEPVLKSIRRYRSENQELSSSFDYYIFEWNGFGDIYDEYPKIYDLDGEY